MKKNQEKDWGKFYREGLAPKEPTDFCRFIMGIDFQADSLVELGCGNGRDLKMLSRKYTTFGIDKNFEPDLMTMLSRKAEKGETEDLRMTTIIKEDFNAYLPALKTAGIVYSRFFLHSISNDEIIKILENTKKYFCAEFRVKGDEPVLYADHKRNLIDPMWLIIVATEMFDFEVMYYYRGRGMAKYKNEDPLVARIVLRRKNIWKE